MANCDWGRPCDCRECRRKDFEITCPHCGFENCVSVDRTSRWETDRKGMSYYEFDVPVAPIRDLNCYSCKQNIENAGVYDSIRIKAMDWKINRKRSKDNGNVCYVCEKVEQYDRAYGYEEVRLGTRNGKKYCQDCVVDVIKSELPDPSDEMNKYSFSRTKLQWELEKIKRPCAKCGKQRWLNASNVWKKVCITCYRS